MYNERDCLTLKPIQCVPDTRTVSYITTSMIIRVQCWMNT